VKAIRKAAAAVCSLSDTEFDVRFNPDIFSPCVKHGEPAVEKVDTVNEETSDKKESPKVTAETEESEKREQEQDSSKEVSKSRKYPPLELQMRLNKESCEFLLLFQIPQFVRDITSNRYRAST